MTNQELDNLKPNTVVKYGMFQPLLYKGKDERHVIMQDAENQEKKVYIELFLKYAKVA
jgi:hypothetical protein